MTLQLQSESLPESCKGHEKFDSPKESKTSPKSSPKASPKVFQTAQGDFFDAESWREGVGELKEKT